MDRVAIALGSNLGDRGVHLSIACRRLSLLLDDFRVSSIHETAPVGTSTPQPNYLNAAATGSTRLGPRALLALLGRIELERRRERPAPNAARTLDLDLILFSDRVVHEPGLIVPHPRFRERTFVLAPLAEIAAGWIDPVSGKTVGELLAEISGRG